MEKVLSIETGVVEYTLNDTVTVRFNPTDVNFIDRLYSAFVNLDEEQEKYRADVAAADDATVFDISRAADAEMREKINSVFGEDICGPLFGNTSVYAMGGGLPLWANLILAIIDEVDDRFATERKETSPRLQKYISKYKKK